MSDINSELDAIQRASQQASQASWFKFEKIGDQVQGTLIASYQAKSPAGQDQIVYVIKSDNGTYNVARNVNDERVHRVMNSAVLGDIVRFVLTDIIPHKIKGYNAIKAVDAYRRADIVDKVWLAENGGTSAAAAPAAAPEAPAPAAAPVAEADETSETETSLGGELPKEA